MDADRKKTRALLIILLALVLVLSAVCVFLLIERGAKNTTDSETDAVQGNGLFSWHDEVFEADERDVLFKLMREHGLTELYQDVPYDMPVSRIREFAKACAQNGVRLYLLVGEPEWALDRDGRALCEQIQRAALMGVHGVMVDIEPGSTDEWKDDRESVMETMTEAYIRGRDSAAENGLEMIVCLSYYYDDYGFENELETVVRRGCDALAIMNYNRDDEIGQIETEAALCSAYGKRIINIYELQEVGKFDLEENHTYRTAGLSALKESAESVERHFSEQKITTALHEYRALKEMSGY